MHISLRILLALLGFIVTILAIAGVAQLATASWPPVVAIVVAGTAVSAGVLWLVRLLRRRLDRKPWDLLKFDRTALPLVVCGIALAAVVALAGGAVSVWLGFADWGLEDAVLAELSRPATIISLAATTLLVQGFPEELVFRGYILGNLHERLPLWGAVVISSLIFGSIHVVSRSGATTISERLVYAVMAIGFGLVLAVCRTVSGSLWLGIGFHAGHDAFVRMFVTVRPDAFIAAYLVTFGALATAAAVAWRASRRTPATL